MPILKPQEHEAIQDLIKTRTGPADLTQAVWQKSTYSGSGSGNCVEVASNLPGIIAVRDSKDPHGPALMFSTVVWTVLLHEISAIPGLIKKRIE